MPVVRPLFGRISVFDLSRAFELIQQLVELRISMLLDEPSADSFFDFLKWTRSRWFATEQLADVEA
jgi:hypothetical protein